MRIPRFSCEVYPSTLAKHRLRQRRISRHDLESAILRGNRTVLQGKKWRARWQGIEVVYIPKPCHYWVISAGRM